MRFLSIILIAFALSSCNRDPNVAKKRYLENGNKYFDKGRYKEASIMYRTALQKDLKYGEAYYRLALTDLKLGKIPSAVGSLKRAIELTRPDQPEHVDASIKLADLYVAAIPGARQVDRQQFIDEVDRIANALLKKDRNPFEGHRLLGDLALVGAQEAFNAGNAARAKEPLQKAIAEFRKADAIKPLQVNVSVSLARCLAADGKAGEAETLYKSLLDKDKSLPIPYSELYRLYINQNNPAEGEKILKAGFQNNPKEYGFLTMLATHYYALQRRDEMVKVLNELKSHAKEYQQAYLTAGDFYVRVGDGEQAIRQYEEGIAANPKQKATYQKRIIEILMKQGKRAEAAQMNESILKENPKDNDARGLQATMLLNKGEVQKAIAELQSVVTSVPDNFVARFNLGRAHAAKGEYEQARQQFTQTIQLRPDYIPARVGLAQLYLARGDFDQAIRAADEILAFDKQNRQAILVQSGALMRTQKYGEARTLLQGLLKTNDNLPEVWFQLGMINLSEGRYKDSEDAFRKSYQLEPANDRGLMGVVETYIAQKKTDQAIQTLKAEAEKFPDRTGLRLALANTTARAGKYDLAIPEFQYVLSKIENNPIASADVYARLAEAFRLKGDLSAGIAAMEKAKGANPENYVVLTNLAVLLDGAGRKKEARQLYEQVLKQDPNNGPVLNNLAFLLAETDGDLDQALTYAQRAKQTLPKAYEVADTLGWIYLKKNLSDNAVETLQDLVTKQPENATYRLHFAMALLQKGDKPKALKELQTALHSNPSKEEEPKIKDLIAKMQK